MPEDPSTPPPDSAPPGRGAPRVGAAFAGETTGAPLPESSSGSDPTVMMNAPRAETVGDFEIISKLGQGGMGAVYRARQISLDRQIALKLLPASLEADADFVSRFQREARVAASLNHANLVKVYASGEADGTHFIAMELIEGETLGDFLKRGPLPPLEALRICGDVARALEHGWNRAQLIHRDIKPGNIFLSTRGEVKVGDLGLAKTMGGDTTGLTQTGTAMGTPHYISPEQARGDKEIDFRADIYSLGCTLYQMLTGRTPYEGREPMVVMNMHINAPPPAILKVLPGCPIPLARLVGKMLKKAKHERQASYAELLAQIEQVQALFAPTASVLESALPADPDSTLLATPAATPRSGAAVPGPAGSARRAIPEQGTPGGRSLPGKSKLPLYGTIAAGVAVLVVVIFAVLPKEEKLTKAERYAREQEAKRAAATPAPEPAPAPVKSTASTTAEPAAIKLWNSPETIPAKPGVTWADGALRLDKSVPGFQSPTVSRPLMRDVALRGTVGLNREAEFIIFAVRFGGTVASGLHGYQLGIETKSGFLRLQSMTGGPSPQILRKWTLTRPLGAYQWMPVELRVVGDELTVSADGVVLGKVQDNSITEPGQLQIFSTGPGPGYIRDIEYVPLDGVASASAPAEQWQDVLRDPARLNLAAKGVEHTPQGLRFSEGYGTQFRPGQGPERDGAIRMRTAFGGVRTQLLARLNDSGEGYQLFVLNDRRIDLARLGSLGKTAVNLAKIPLPTPLQPGQKYDLELRVVGAVLTAKFNGEVIATVTDTTLPTGRLGVGLGGNIESGPSLVEVLEVLNLDAAPTTSAAVAPAPAAEPWQDVLGDPAKLRLQHTIERTPDGLRFNDGGTALIAGAPLEDGAIRFRATNDGNEFEVRVRRSEISDAYVLKLTHSKSVQLKSWDNTARRETILRDFVLREPVPNGKEYVLGMRVVGQTLTATLNGEILGSVTDGTLVKGYFGVGLTKPVSDGALVKALEFLALDTPGAAKAAAPAAEPWQDLLREPAKLSLAQRGVERTAEGLRFTTSSSANLHPDLGVKRDGAIRGRTAFGGLRMQMRARTSPGGFYLLVVHNQSRVRLERWDAATQQSTLLREFPLREPLQAGQEYELELRVVGSTLTAKLNRELLGTVTDTVLSEGRFSTGTFDVSAEPTVLSTLQFLDLDSPPSAAATPSAGGMGSVVSPSPAIAATKDAPFVNSLGMKFVPVPIVGGPTDGKRVLFSIWETRVQDFNSFPHAVGRGWKYPGIKSALHPATGVSWEDAQQFCVWLTEYDRSKGRIGADLAYRLPTDHEWSCAIGLVDEKATDSPQSKLERGRDIFPWGKGWPPPAETMNLSGAEIEADRTWPEQKVLAGWRDAFPKTAPVGSFAPNALGLHDLSGNVYEWCADFLAPNRLDKVMRGSSFADSFQERAASSFRLGVPAAGRRPDAGFRVVLAPVP